MFFIFNTKAVFSNQNHDNDNHPLASSINCPNESDTEGRKYLTEGMMHSEDMFNELRKREYYETRNERKRKEKAASTRRCIRKREKLEKLEV